MISPSLVLEEWMETKQNLGCISFWISCLTLLFLNFQFVFPWEKIAGRFSLVSFQQVFLCLNTLQPKPNTFILFIDIYICTCMFVKIMLVVVTVFRARFWHLLLHMQCHRGFSQGCNPSCVWPCVWLWCIDIRVVFDI